MAFRQTLKHLDEDRVVDRPRIKKHLRRRRTKQIVYIQPNLLYRSATIRGLLEEIKYGNSTIKLYALLTLKAILKDCDDKMKQRLKRTYGYRLKQLTPAGLVD
jgi:hypothetical protein